MYFLAFAVQYVNRSDVRSSDKNMSVVILIRTMNITVYEKKYMNLDFTYLKLLQIKKEADFRLHNNTDLKSALFKLIV